MPPHGNLTNMGFTEPEAQRKKMRIKNNVIEKLRKNKRLGGNIVDLQAQTDERVHDPWNWAFDFLT